MGLQSGSIWISLLTGFGLAVLYDCFRILRTMVSGHTGHSSVQDFFFMLFSGLITYLLAIAVDFGRVRFFLLACEVIGACVYFMTIGVVTHKIASWLHRIFFVVQTAVCPVFCTASAVLPWKVRQGAGEALEAGQKFSGKNGKKRKNPLKSPSELVYNQTVDVYKKKVTVQRADGAGGEQRDEGNRRKKKKK